MRAKGAPILEFDRGRVAIIEPSRVHQAIEMPEHCVPCFFLDVIARLVAEGAREIDRGDSETSDYKIYEINYEGRPLTIFNPTVGAAVAAMRLERLIARGGRKFVACGSAGALDGALLPVGHIIVPDAAVRDEGTSYHYLPSGREIGPTARALHAIEETLHEHGHDYRRGKTWTTDAPYRETAAKVRRRRAEGCIAVEMEAAAFFAVARFRGVEFGQILYAGDDVGGKTWDPRRDRMRHQAREQIFHLAAEACLRL